MSKVLGKIGRIIVVLIAIVAALVAKEANAENDLTPPVVVSIDVGPSFVDTSSGTQVVTITAHITDDLSGCPVNDWCLNFFFVPLHGPEDQAKSSVVGYADRISGTATDGIYQTTIELPQYSYEGRWVLDRFLVFDNVRNRCAWERDVNSGSTDICPYSVDETFFVNRVDDFEKPSLIFLPYVTAD